MQKEYEIAYETAKNMKEYEFSWEENLDCNTLKTKINEYIKTKNEKIIDELTNVLCVMTFGSLDIEFQIFGLEENGDIDSSFFICYQTDDINNKYSQDGWRSYGFCDSLVFSVDMLNNEEDFKKQMFEEMISEAKKHSLTWSKRNIIRN